MRLTDDEARAYAARYDRWARAVKRCPGGERLLRRANRGLTLAFYGAYAALLGWVALGAAAPLRAVPLVVVPGAAFLLVSWYRRRTDAPRPYECCPLNPLIEREGKGQSFPSRHGFSAFTIATCWFAASAPAAVALLVAAAALGACRVLGGVHFPRDIVAGAVVGIATGALACAMAWAM